MSGRQSSGAKPHHSMSRDQQRFQRAQAIPEQRLPPPDKGLGPQVREFGDTLSVFDVLREHFKIGPKAPR
jgi:hypothetical protein